LLNHIEKGAWFGEISLIWALIGKKSINFIYDERSIVIILEKEEEK